MFNMKKYFKNTLYIVINLASAKNMSLIVIQYTIQYIQLIQGLHI